MNRAEHSPPNPSAPHGASQTELAPSVFAPVSPVSSRARRAAQSRLTLPGQPASHSHNSAMLSRRRAVSGCALLSILAFGPNLAPAIAATPKAPSFRFLTPPPLPVAAKSGGAVKIGASKATSKSGASKAGALLARRVALASVPRIALAPRVAVAPRKALMPRAAQTAAPRFPLPASALRLAQGFGREMVRLSAKNSAPTSKATASVAAPKWVASAQGGGKVVRFASTAPRPQLQTTPQPAFRTALAPQKPLAPARLVSAEVAAKPNTPDLGGMKKVIDASSLTLPPLSQPLPTWMQSAAVKIDRLEKRMPLPAAPPKRFAQNPAAAPIRNPATPVTSSDRLANQIEVATSTFVVLLTTTDLQTVAVADPAIADVAVVNSRSVLLNGKTPGVTSLVIVDGQKIRQYTVRVTASPGSRAVDIAGAIGIPGVVVRPLKDALVLEGEVASAEEARRAVEIAGIYATKVVNQLSIRGQVSQEAGAAASLRDLINMPGVSVRVSGETAILTGTVDSPQQIQDADVIARTASKNVLNLLRLPALSVDQVRESLGGIAAAPIGSDIGGPSAPGVFNTPSPLVLRQSGGSLLLEGAVSSQAQLDQILAQAARTGLPLINRLQAPAALTADQGTLAAIAQAIGRPGVRVSGSAKRLVLEGIVANTEEAVAVEQIARAYAAQVDNMLQTPNPRLVDVDISIVEITRIGLKNLGFTFPSLLDSSNTGFVLGQRSIRLDLPGSLPPTNPDASNPTRGALGTQTAFQAALRAEITNQNVRLLSNPRTTVLSGRTATFQVGGQVPVPVSITQSAAGTITGIAFKDFGVLVDVVPNASENGAVTMRIKTEISQPDPSIGFIPFAGAGTIPGFQRRAATTEVTTSPGGTIALGGLISTTTRTLITKVPLLGSLPILGSLFQSKRFQNDQSELVIFVTPRLLANPLPNGGLAPAGVVAVGNTANVGTVLGNPGLQTGGIVGGAAGP